jgi:G3E family GTPase
VAGFLGAGKSTLVRRILERAPPGLRLGLLVNDVASLNVDGRVVRAAAASRAGGGGGGAEAAAAPVVELSGGCICCSLKGDMLVAAARLAVAAPLDYLIIESTGVGEPAPIVAAFHAPAACGRSLATSHFRIDAVATVADAPRLAELLYMTQQLAAPSAAAAPPPPSSQPPPPPLAELLAEQLEGADIVLLNKADGLDADGLDAAEAAVRALNPRARVLRTRFADVSPSDVLHTRRFDHDAAAASPRWAAALEAGDGGGGRRESEEYGIGTFVYARRRPFHPARLWAALHGGGGDAGGGGGGDALPPCLRSKGWFWLAHTPSIAWEWSAAGDSRTFKPFGTWLAHMLPRHLWPLAVERRGWHPRWGDRRQALVFIGQGLRRERIAAILDSCLVTDQEAGEEEAWEAAPPDAWSALVVD